MQEFSIRKKICDVSDEFTNKIKKKEKLQTPGAILQREAFKDKLNKCLDVSAADAEDDIKADRKRTDKDKDEDLKFLRDQLSDRKMFLSVYDKDYNRKVENKRKREEQKGETKVRRGDSFTNSLSCR